MALLTGRLRQQDTVLAALSCVLMPRTAQERTQCRWGESYRPVLMSGRADSEHPRGQTCSRPDGCPKIVAVSDAEHPGEATSSKASFASPQERIRYRSYQLDSSAA